MKNRSLRLAALLAASLELAQVDESYTLPTCRLTRRQAPPGTPREQAALFRWAVLYPDAAVQEDEEDDLLVELIRSP